jgi:hypothetical protein
MCFCNLWKKGCRRFSKKDIVCVAVNIPIKSDGCRMLTRLFTMTHSHFLGMVVGMGKEIQNLFII